MQRYFLECGDRNYLQSLMQTSGKLQPLFGDGDQQIGANRRPDLDDRAVGVVREEPAQTQVLLDPPKEQLDLPPALVNRGYDQRRQSEVVGQEDQREVAVGLVVADAAQLGRVTLAGFGRVQADGLIATQAGGLVHPPRFAPVESGVAIGPGHEPSPGLMNPPPANAIEVSPVEDVVTARNEYDIVQEIDIVPLARAERAERGQRGVDRQHRVALHRRLRSLPAHPRKNRQAQLDQAGVDGEQLPIQVQFGRRVPIKTLGPAHQHHGDLGKELRRTVFVGLGQVATLDRPANARVIQQARPRSQTRLDVSKALAISQLRKNHRCEVIVGRQGWRLPHRRVTSRATVKLLGIQTGENLGQYRFAEVDRQNSAFARSRNQIEDTSFLSLPIDG
jgi:hypothetical protein